MPIDFVCWQKQKRTQIHRKPLKPPLIPTALELSSLFSLWKWCRTLLTLFILLMCRNFPTLYCLRLDPASLKHCSFLSLPPSSFSLSQLLGLWRIETTGWGFLEEFPTGVDRRRTELLHLSVVTPSFTSQMHFSVAGCISGCAVPGKQQSTVFWHSLWIFSKPHFMADCLPWMDSYNCQRRYWDRCLLWKSLVSIHYYKGRNIQRKAAGAHLILTAAIFF